MWAFIIKLVFSFALSALLVRRPEPPTPATIEDVNQPTADETRIIVHIFGRRRIDDANCLWYGDIGYTPIKRTTPKK